MSAPQQTSLGAIRYERRCNVDGVLCVATDELSGRGFAIAGVVQHNEAPE